MRLVSRRELVLWLAACLGAVAFFVFLPYQHPDQAVRFYLDRTSAVRLAERFVRAQGYDVGGLTAQAVFRRTPELLELLGQQHGRMGLTRRLREHGAHLPAYYWEVSWEPQERDTNSAPMSWAEGARGSASLRVRLSPAGLPWYLERHGPPPIEQSADGALARDSAWALARLRLGTTLWGRLGWRPDSVRLLPALGYEVSGMAQLPLLERPVRVVAHIGSDGRLLALRPRWEPLKRAAFGSELGDFMLRLGTYLLVGVALLVVFLRRLHARLVDVPFALSIAVGGAVLATIALVLPVSNLSAQDPPQGDFWLAVIPVVFTFLLALLGGAGVFFVLGATAESLARQISPDRFRALAALARGDLRSRALAQALRRGGLGALALAGLTALLIALIPEAPASFDQRSQDWTPMLIRPYALFVLGASGWLGGFLVLMGLLGGVALVYRRWPRPWVFGLGPALLWVGLAGDPMGFSLHPWTAQALPQAASGLVMGWLFWRYDALTAWLAYWGASAWWGLRELGSPLTGSLTGDGVALLAFPLLLLAAGYALGLLKPSSEEEGPYLPAYLQELTRRQRLERELEIARQVQLSFLPRRTPQRPGLEIAARCEPALEVGGDYYDFCELDAHRIGVLIGDVSGKGIPAAFYMTLVKGLVQPLSEQGLPPAEVLCRLNRLFHRHAQRGLFLSMLYGILDLRDRSFTFARAGHTPLLLWHRGQKAVESLRPPGMAIGLVADSRFEAHLVEERIHLEPGDVLVLYTDGLSEARNAQRELLEEKVLLTLIQEHAHQPAEGILEELLRAVERFENGASRTDDRTLVVIRLHPQTHEPGADP